MKFTPHLPLFLLLSVAGFGAEAVDLEQLDKAANAFAGREDVQALVRDNRPQLADAYPLIVRDYFSNVGRHERLPEPRPARVRLCARHYENIWLHRRFVWPMTDAGTPDWAAIYVQALDHYLGFCLRYPQLQKPGLP